MLSRVVVPQAVRLVLPATTMLVDMLKSGQRPELLGPFRLGRFAAAR